MKKYKYTKYILVSIIITSVILIFSSTNIFANKTTNLKYENEIDKIFQEKIKEIEEEKDIIVELSKDGLSSITNTANVVLGLIALISIFGIVKFGYDYSKEKKLKKELNKNKYQIKKYKSDLDKIKISADLASEKLNKSHSEFKMKSKEQNIAISYVYEKLGDIDVESENYESAKDNYKKSIEFNEENVDSYYKLGREIEKLGHGIPKYILGNDIKDTINEEHLKNKNEALECYERLIYKNNINGYIGKIHIFYYNLEWKYFSDIDKAIYYFKKAVSLCNDDKILSKLYSYLGYLYKNNNNYSKSIDYYYKALKYDDLNIDANIALCRGIEFDNKHEKFDYICSRIEKLLNHHKLYRGYKESILDILLDMYLSSYKGDLKLSKEQIWRLIILLEKLEENISYKQNNEIHLCPENRNYYGKKSIDYSDIHYKIGNLRANIYYNEKYYDNALKEYKKLFNYIQYNNKYNSTVSRSLKDGKVNVSNEYEIFNSIGYILNILKKEYDESIVYFNSAISYIDAEIEEVNNKHKGNFVQNEEVINELKKNQLHIYTNRGYAYQCKAESYDNDNLMVYYLKKSLESYDIAIENYSKYINECDKNTYDEERYYIKAYYRKGKVLKILGDYYYELCKTNNNIDEVINYYKQAKECFSKVKAQNNIEEVYLKDEFDKHLYIITLEDEIKLDNYLKIIDGKLNELTNKVV